MHRGPRKGDGESVPHPAAAPSFGGYQRTAENLCLAHAGPAATAYSDSLCRQSDRMRTGQDLRGGIAAEEPRREAQAALAGFGLCSCGRLTTFTGAGHAPHSEEPERFAAVLADFAKTAARRVGVLPGRETTPSQPRNAAETKDD